MNNTLLANEKRVQRGQVITLDELSEELSDLLYCQGIDCYKVTESFINHGTISYIISGLHMEEIEFGDWVCFSDWDEIFLENKHRLAIFLKRNLEKVHKMKTENENDEMDYYKLQFVNGFIEIRPIIR